VKTNLIVGNLAGELVLETGMNEMRS